MLKTSYAQETIMMVAEGTICTPTPGQPTMDTPPFKHLRLAFSRVLQDWVA